jgi:hypothetical protein
VSHVITATVGICPPIRFHNEFRLEAFTAQWNFSMTNIEERIQVPGSEFWNVPYSKSRS